MKLSEKMKATLDRNQQRKKKKKINPGFFFLSLAVVCMVLIIDWRQSIFMVLFFSCLMGASLIHALHELKILKTFSNKGERKLNDATNRVYSQFRE